MVEEETGLRRAREADARAKGVDDWTSTDIANFVSSHTKGHGQRFTAGTIERAGLTPETMFDHYLLYNDLGLNSAARSSLFAAINVLDRQVTAHQGISLDGGSPTSGNSTIG